MFKRKIKRRSNDKESDDEDDESDDEDYMSSDAESSDEDEEFDDSVCPTGCDAVLYQEVYDLREKRLDIEEALAEQRKSAEQLKKEIDSQERREKTLSSSMATAEKDLANFQLEKQAKLNELDIAVPLKLDQIFSQGENHVLSFL